MKKILGLIFIFGLTFGYIFYSQNDFENSQIDESENILKTLPNIEVEQLSSKNVKSLYDFLINKNKKVIIVHFWGTWCGPCLKEFPEMIRLIDKFKDNKDIIFFLIAANDQKLDVKKFFKTYKSFAKNTHVLIENKNLHRTLFGVTKVPETFIFSGDLNLLKRFNGPQNWDNQYYSKYLNSLL